MFMMLILCAHTIYSVRFITVHYFVSCFKRIIETRNDLLPCRHGIFRVLQDAQNKKFLSYSVFVSASPKKSCGLALITSTMFETHIYVSLSPACTISICARYLVFNDLSARTLREMQRREAYPPPRTPKNTVLLRITPAQECAACKA